ncbi:MAG: hypothetical protein LIR50_15080 [Bacillota bacterium]|nr:hypothetical protein [Bacillota bacterium]
MNKQEPFIKASKDVLGDDNVYFMISYKPLQNSSAFRLWCKANDMDVNDYNDIAKNLDDYIDDKKWKNIIEESKRFRGVIESVSPSPCSFLLYDKPISKEIGLIRVGDQSKKTHALCCCMDKYSADQYKYLKNDYLVVQVLNIIKGTCDLANIKIPTLNELESKLDEKTWDIYAKGLTATVNQADSDFARPLAMKYKMHSVAEVARWVAAIRPGFGNLSSFLNREKYSTGVPQIDELLESSQHFILFQENIMQFLIYCGIEEDLTYGIIKNISKKHMTKEDFEKLKEKLKEGYKDKIGSYNGFEKIWEDMASASKYSFNSSHALSYAYDSIYCAYLKSHYPLEYFSTVLNMYSGNIDETEKITKELPYFNISIKLPKFRYSKGSYFPNKKTNSIYKGISSIKYCNSESAEQMYLLKDKHYDTFVDLLVDLTENTSINSRQLNILIMLNFFSEFGENKKLSKIYEEFTKGKNKYGKKYVEKTKIKRIAALKESENMIPDEKLDLASQIRVENDSLGYVQVQFPDLPKSYIYVMDQNLKFSPRIDAYCLATGATKTLKMYKKQFLKNPFSIGDVINVSKYQQKNKAICIGKDDNGKPQFEKSDETEWWISKYTVVDDINKIIK